MRWALVLLLCALPAAAGKKAKTATPDQLAAQQGTREAFKVPERELRLAVDRVFAKFAALGWAVREENDSVHGVHVKDGVTMTLHAYLRRESDESSAVEIVLESGPMGWNQRKAFQHNILLNVEKELKRRPKAATR